MSTETVEAKVSKRELPKHGIGIVLVLVLMGILFWYFDIEQIRAFVEKGGIWGPIVFILAKASTIIVAPLSGSAIYPMAGAIFGFWHGFTYIFIGDAIGSAIAFWISRHFGVHVAQRFMGASDGGYLTHILEHLNSWRGLIEARICFSALPEAVAYAAGLSRISFSRFIVVQMGLGIPTIAAMVAFGSLLNISDNPLIMGLLLAMGAVAMLAGGSLFMVQVKRRMDAMNHTDDSSTQIIEK
jgi:uncharacterized membrane protein YdjX (TVP38/TMEM64 family)